MEQIERPREDNQPSDATVFKYIQQYRPDNWKIDFENTSDGLQRFDVEEQQEAA